MRYNFIHIKCGRADRDTDAHRWGKKYSHILLMGMKTIFSRETGLKYENKIL